MTADITATRTADDAVTLTVRGPLDVLTAPDFAALAHQTIADLTAGQLLIIDVNAVNILAVAGVRALLAATQLSTAKGVHSYVLMAPDHDARRVLEALDAAPQLPLITDAAAITGDRSP
ncbi:STAS domain-containing protein [Actinoplanes sp. TFC3]|uniref:STAS domain-containing protein n=1 Tax=Actinoplanes sp. TFC3 TaxID=1710355 RepID=UPI000829FF0A|nr:STAS domain-containing protein [Actinoplanes sp. TFC3]